MTKQKIMGGLTNLLFNRTPRNLLLISTVMLAIIIPLLTTTHASATTPQAVIGMPFTGLWAYNTNVNPPYTDSNSSHPSSTIPLAVVTGQLISMQLREQQSNWMSHTGQER
jgi:hypothetical protein